MASVNISEPANQATINTDSVTVYGSVNGFTLISVELNGQAGEVLSQSEFSGTIPLELGTNSIEVKALGPASNQAVTNLEITRVRGVALSQKLDNAIGSLGCSMVSGPDFLIVGLLLFFFHKRLGSPRIH